MALGNMREHDYWVYILTNKRCSTLYIGVTNNIVRRLYQHRFGEVKGFSKRYRLSRARLARALSQCERCDRVREEAERMAPQQEKCADRTNKSAVARFK